MPKRPGLNVNFDAQEAHAAMGAIVGIGKAVKTDRYVSDIINYAHREMSTGFDEHMDLMSGAMREKFHHIYEWNMIGLPAGRLWNHTLTGRGTNKLASFEFIASKMPIPNPEQRAANPDDPMSQVPEDVVQRLSKRKYYFTWKAPMMEYRLHATIAPRWASKLFIPMFDQPRGYILTPHAVNQQSGNVLTAGSFTTAFIDWFNGPGRVILEEKVAREVELDMVAASQQWRKKVKASTVQARMQTWANPARAFEIGKQSAEQFLIARRRGND